MQKIVISRNKEVNFKQLLLFEPYQEEVYISLWNCQTTTRQTKEIQHFACCVNGPDIRAVWILRVQSISTCTKCVSRIKNDKSEISSLLLKLIPSVALFSVATGYDSICTYSRTIHLTETYPFKCIVNLISSWIA